MISYSATKNSGLSKKILEKESGAILDYVDLKKLPQFNSLNEQVVAILRSSTWLEKYGKDWIILFISVFGYFSCYYLLSFSDPMVFIAGVILLGLCHSSITVKSAHLATHKALCSSDFWNRVWSFFCTDFIGTFSADVGYSIHVKCHHPHTNIIGLGDSSTFRAPFVPSILYMFVTPLLMPILTPVVAMKEILSRSFVCIARHICIAYLGLAFHVYLLITLSGMKFPLALMTIFFSRDVLAIPYIHVNIFQHIGLPMYSPQHRPKKMYQMTTGVLNLPRNPILDLCFGHGIISCHTEHHLFPLLSDNMCLKIQPLVKKFCQEHYLPYHMDTYSGRVWHFLNNYKHLMVDAPPVTKFVGLQ